MPAGTFTFNVGGRSAASLSATSTGTAPPSRSSGSRARRFRRIQLAGLRLEHGEGRGRPAVAAVPARREALGVLPGTPTCAPRAVVATKFHPLAPCRVLDTRQRGLPAGLGSRRSARAESGASRWRTSAASRPAPSRSRRTSRSRTSTARGELVVYPADVASRRLSSALTPSRTPGEQRTIVYLSTVLYVLCFQQFARDGRFHS